MPHAIEELSALPADAHERAVTPSRGRDAGGLVTLTDPAPEAICYLSSRRADEARRHGNHATATHTYPFFKSTHATRLLFSGPITCHPSASAIRL